MAIFAGEVLGWGVEAFAMNCARRASPLVISRTNSLSSLVDASLLDEGGLGDAERMIAGSPPMTAPTAATEGPRDRCTRVMSSWCARVMRTRDVLVMPCHRDVLVMRARDVLVVPCHRDVLVLCACDARA